MPIYRHNAWRRQRHNPIASRRNAGTSGRDALFRLPTTKANATAIRTKGESPNRWRYQYQVSDVPETVAQWKTRKLFGDTPKIDIHVPNKTVAPGSCTKNDFVLKFVVSHGSIREFDSSPESAKEIAAPTKMKPLD